MRSHFTKKEYPCDLHLFMHRGFSLFTFSCLRLTFAVGTYLEFRVGQVYQQFFTSAARFLLGKYAHKLVSDKEVKSRFRPTLQLTIKVGFSWIYLDSTCNLHYRFSAKSELDRSIADDATVEPCLLLMFKCVMKVCF